jgi:hypothetical protein
MRTPLIATILLAAVTLSPDAWATKPTKSAQPKVETISSGDWAIKVSEHEAQAVNKRTKEKIVLYDLAKYDGDCQMTVFKGSVVSVVGTFVSMEIEAGGTCGGAGSFAEHSLYSVDLARGGRRLRITELFDASELSGAIARDPWVIKDKANKNKHACGWEPHTLDTDHFAFHHVEGGQIAVRLAVPRECADNKLIQLGLTLTPDAWLKGQVDAAARAKSLGHQRADKKH